MKALGVVKLFDSLDQAQVAFLDQIQKLHAAAHIALGDGDDQTQVGLAQALLGLLAIGAAGLNFQCQLGFLLGGQQRHAANFLQVDLDRVVNRDAVGSQAVLVVVRALLGAKQGAADVNGRVVDDLDAVAFQLLVELFHRFYVKNVAILLHCVADLTAGQLAGAAARVDQATDRIFLFCHKYVLLLVFYCLTKYVGMSLFVCLGGAGALLFAEGSEEV